MLSMRMLQSVTRRAMPATASLLLLTVYGASPLCAAPLQAMAGSAPVEGGANHQQRKQDSAPAANTAQIEAAKTRAEAWLNLVDAGKYAESWRMAAPFLKKHFTQAAWVKRVADMRKPIDPLVERHLSTTAYRDQFPGLPPGQYVALVWKSSFGAGHQLSESVIMAADGGEWKLIGYAVR